MNIENFKVFYNGKNVKDNDFIIGEQKEINCNLILYTDGSVKPGEGPGVPGVLGSAWHGYFYECNANKTKTSDAPNKGITTTIGYISEANMSQYKKDYLNEIQVAPLGYIDGIYSDSKEIGWSNIAEINAMKYALYTIIDFANRQPEKSSFILNSVLVKSDSTYVLKLIEASLITLKEHSNILEMPNSKIELGKVFNSYKEESIDFIIMFSNILLEVKKVTPEIRFGKVLGHSGDIGNDRVDLLSKMARNNSEISEHGKLCRINYVTTYLHNGKLQDKTWKFWKDKIDWNPLYNFKEIFFIHNEDKLVKFKDENGTEGYFITMMKYPSDVEHGEKSKEPLFGLVFTPDVDDRLVDAITTYEVKAKDSPVLLIAVDLKVLGVSEHMKFEELLKKEVWTLNKKHQLLSMDTTPAVYPIVPPALATYAYNIINGLKDTMGIVIFDIVKHNKKIDRYFVKDITEHIYDCSNDEKKIKIQNTDKYIKVKMELEEGEFTVPIEFTTDIIDRNSLKKFEEFDTKIYLLCVKENVGFYNYYTLIHNRTTGEYAIYCNLYSSKIFLPKEKRKKK